jgi:hypothetical protein
MSPRFIVMGFAATAAMLAVGCSSSSEPKQPDQQGQNQSSPAWTLQLKSTCLDTAADQCLGKYGFSVTAEGAYQVGPGPQGQVRKGVLKDAEFAAVKAWVEAAQASTSAQAENREENYNRYYAHDTVTLSRPGSLARTLLRNEGSDLRFTLASLDEARSLHAAIRDLAISYYRLPFGDGCGDAVDKFNAAALPLQSCQTDSDCVYINSYENGFSVIPPRSAQTVLVEGCVAIKPVTVANKLSILGGAQRLSELYAEARNVCVQNGGWAQSYFDENSLGGRSCSYVSAMTSTPPTCQQNVCKAHL